MLFCGQCGLQLAPGSTACPRCGSVTQPALPPIENPHSEDPTIASDPRLPLQSPRTPYPQVPGYSPIPPSPGSSNPYATEQIPGTPTPSPLPTERVSHPGYPGYPGYPSNPGVQGYPGYSGQTPPSVDYSTQRVQDGGFPPPGSVNYPPSTPGYTDFARGGNAAPPPQEPAPKRRGNGGFIALLLILLVVIVVALVLVRPAWLFGNPNIIQTPTATTASATATPTATATAIPTATATNGPTAVQLAQNTVQSYYTDINNRDYQSAYNLWLSYPQSEAQFASGFTNTIQDSLTITGASQLPDGTVQVSVTLVAQSTTGTTTYNGYYIVQQSNGSWLIQRGHLA